MIEATEHYFNKRENEQEQRYKFCNMFIDDIGTDLETIQVTIKRLRIKAKDYYGFDFREDLEDLLHDLI